MNTTDYLDILKTKQGIKSDYAIAKHLGLTRAAVSRYKTKKSFFSDEIAVKVANELDLNVGVVLADIHAERETDPVLHNAWVQIARSLSQATAAVFMVVLLGIPTHNAEAGTSISLNSKNLPVYTLCEPMVCEITQLKLT